MLQLLFNRVRWQQNRNIYPLMYRVGRYFSIYCNIFNRDYCIKGRNLSDNIEIIMMLDDYCDIVSHTSVYIKFFRFLENIVFKRIKTISLIK
jgi:hypothetical protein